jgi:hypothetical protein
VELYLHFPNTPSSGSAQKRAQGKTLPLILPQQEDVLSQLFFNFVLEYAIKNVQKISGWISDD